MHIVTTDFVSGAQAARGVAVIIDVFRAFTVACYGLERGASALLPVGEVEEALALRQQYPDALLIGEREGKPLPGFDIGNSPSQILSTRLNGRPVIQTTHAGTQGLVNATQADVVLTGALVNAAATARYIQSLAPETVTLVRMGWKAETRTDEDDACAEYLHRLLLGETPDTNSLKQQLMRSPCAARFLDPAQPWNPREDLGLCLAVNRFNFALKANRNSKGQLALTHVQLPQICPSPP
ncbi:2-phosphosulfolactate phosphatase [Alteromonas aestuariivivens]|uniref:Probable 2-phosphosulfolactate phosphatase n=1 Tax=Alteromonas aestuariivivens TaxID=1938339 RepID=A0A3D8M9B8_9ALTE|nr:2-phosphosulfolactate phosphatase [Alteromonas aestuariivivens]RDV26617.1 2-phosphosulfolactate phosphatase [Alteromonas aestuariivivens]